MRYLFLFALKNPSPTSVTVQPRLLTYMLTSPTLPESVEMDNTTGWQDSSCRSPDYSGISAHWLLPNGVDEDIPLPAAQYLVSVGCQLGNSAGMIRQLEAPTYTENQLFDEVREAYENLSKVEWQCIHTREYAKSQVELSQPQWHVLISKHQELLDEHHDFLLLSQHPSASYTLKSLASTYKMPARMWCHGVYSFLELLRGKLPGSEEHILPFIDVSYRMIALLLESVPVFKGTWIECLGDLALYRKLYGPEEDSKHWAEVSRDWYNQAADQNPGDGRIQRHLAVLSRPDILQGLFHCTKALICVCPFPNALSGMTELVTPLMNMPAQERSLTTLFVATHGALFLQAPVEAFVSRANAFLAILCKNGLEGQQGVQITSCNISAIFQYGSKDGVMEKDFNTNLTTKDRLSATQRRFSVTPVDATKYTDISSQLTFRASSLAFHTLITMPGQHEDPSASSSVHISMAFVWCLTLNPDAIDRLEPLVPWSLLATYLNTLFGHDIIISKVEDEPFPHLEGATFQQLPEDLLIGGQAWSRIYYPENFFDGVSTRDGRQSSEGPSDLVTRKHRCLWLGARISTVCFLFFSFDNTSTYQVILVNSLDDI